MSIVKKQDFANGITVNYHVISKLEITNEQITVYLDSFVDSEHFNLAIKRNNLLNEQKELENQYDSLINLENPTKTQQNKLTKVVDKLNTLADEIANCKDYSNYIANTAYVSIPFIDNFSVSNIEKELKKLDLI